MQNVTVSGGSNREQFMWDGKKISRSVLLPKLEELLGDKFDFSLSASKKTDLILLPDDVDEPSHTKTSKAPNAKWMHLKPFLAQLGIRETSRPKSTSSRKSSRKESKSSSTKQRTRQGKSSSAKKESKTQVRAKIKSLTEQMKKMQLEIDQLSNDL